MSSRHPASPQSTFGLLAWLEETRVALPLKGVECRFDVIAGVASVEVDQIFHQSHAQPLNCIYSFPLPAGAAVYRCELLVNGRTISARVEAREEAKRIFVEMKAAGHRAALVAVERENLFTLTLGNVQPDDVIVVRLAYFQTIERLASALSLRIPVCPGVRYIPGKPLLRSLSGRGTADDTDQVPDASRISPPRIEALHREAAYFAVEGKIARSDAADDTLSSPTHPMVVRANETQIDVALANRGAVPDRDVVLRWTEPVDTALTPRAWSFSRRRESYALVQLRAPAEAPVAEAVAKDYYFLLDRSGSMAGAKWVKACEALVAFVRLLGSHDRVWITAFESQCEDFVEAPLPAPALLRDKAFLQLADVGVGGGTDLLPATEHVLGKLGLHSPKGGATLILITDGEIGNEREVLTRFREAPGVTVHAFGIDTTVNEAFLKSLARQQRGECWLLTPNDDIAGTVSALGARLRRPIVTDLKIHGAWTPAVLRLPDVHAGQVVELSLRLSGTKPRPIEIDGVLGNGEPHTFRLVPQSVDNAALALLWARERIATLLANGQSEAALALAREHNILCEGAAFVAWDEAEQVQVAVREIYQPSLEARVARLVNQHSNDQHLCHLYVGDRFPSRSMRIHAPSPTTPTPPLCSSEPIHPESEIEVALVNAAIPPQVAAAFARWFIATWNDPEDRGTAIREFIQQIELAATEAAVFGHDDEFARIACCRRFIADHPLGDGAMRAELEARVAEWSARASTASAARP